MKAGNEHGITGLVSMPGGGKRGRQTQRDACGKVFEDLESGSPIEEIMEQFHVTREQIQAVLGFARRSLDATANYLAQLEETGPP